MATTSYKSRVIYKKLTKSDTDLSKVDFAGSYTLLCKAKSIPAPLGAPNTVESTTLEDDSQTFEEGIKQVDSKEFTGNLEKEYLDKIDNLSGERCCIIQLYGTDGIGSVAKYAYIAQVSANPSDIGGNDEIVEMSVTAIPNTVAKKVTDALTVADNGDGTFTVAKVG